VSFNFERERAEYARFYDYHMGRLRGKTNEELRTAFMNTFTKKGHRSCYDRESNAMRAVFRDLEKWRGIKYVD